MLSVYAYIQCSLGHVWQNLRTLWILAVLPAAHAVPRSVRIVPLALDPSANYRAFGALCGILRGLQLLLLLRRHATLQQGQHVT